jgi:hypothetical protein
MFIKEHSIEEHYLRRRLELLEYLDNFARDEFYNTEPEDKMKKDELIQLCAKLNKSINIARPTKKDLIEIILN